MVGWVLAGEGLLPELLKVDVHVYIEKEPIRARSTREHSHVV